MIIFVLFCLQEDEEDEEEDEEDEEDEEKFQSDAFVNTMEKSIDMFVQQMTKVQGKGKHIALDTSVQVSSLGSLY